MRGNQIYNEADHYNSVAPKVYLTPALSLRYNTWASTAAAAGARLPRLLFRPSHTSRPWSRLRSDGL